MTFPWSHSLERSRRSKRLDMATTVPPRLTTLRRTRQLYWAAVVPNWEAQGYIEQATRSGAPLILCPSGFDEEAAQRLQAALARVVCNEELVSGVRRPLRHSLGEALPC